MREKIMRDTENYIYFLNATFKVEKNPTYTGNHELARTNHKLAPCQ